MNSDGEYRTLGTVKSSLQALDSPAFSQYVFALANGGGREGFFYNDWSREPGLAISSCNDGFRPVIFKLEATDIPSEKGK